MTNTTVKIGIVAYPGVMESALHGLSEMFLIANMVSEGIREPQKFSVEIYDVSDLPSFNMDQENRPQVVIIPPDMESSYAMSTPQDLINWLLDHHRSGTIICSVCAGAFILAESGLLDERQATTHWALADIFAKKYPAVKLDSQKILINDGDIITAAGLMSWLDLGLELVAQFTHPNIMRLLGKNLIVDTGLREQRYYEGFTPKLDHGDQAILKAQHYLQQNFSKTITTKLLSQQSILTSRTFLRRFVKATGFKPTHYLQRLRIQEACNLIESTNGTFESISLKVGYEDTGAFRKTFLKIIGLTPREFKGKFSTDGGSPSRPIFGFVKVK
jgi:transcriptional regulator GlxA family with amidase domain